MQKRKQIGDCNFMKKEKNTVTLYEKAAAIAMRLEIMNEYIIYRPEWVLRRATAEEIDFYYEKMCCGEV